MPIPELVTEGYLPPGIHEASLRETLARFGVGSAAREQKGNLLRLVVEAAQAYPTIKRILVWGSFVTTKPSPNDLDYSLVVSNIHRFTEIASMYQRFLVPSEARLFYGTDVNYLVVVDYPLGTYIERVDFMCRQRNKVPSGIVEIPLRGEMPVSSGGEL